VTLAILVLALVTLQRLTELVIARRNTAALLAKGAYEVAPEHYPFIVAVHSLWLAGLWWLAPEQPVSIFWLTIFCVLQAGRVWVLVTLGPRWTTRIIILPGAPLVADGPYRFLSHPNYLIVAGEIAVLPLAFDLYTFALIFSLFNALVLWVRIRAESKALDAVVAGARNGNDGRAPGRSAPDTDDTR
jgi:methyltransferase